MPSSIYVLLLLIYLTLPVPHYDSCVIGSLNGLKTFQSQHVLKQNTETSHCAFTVTLCDKFITTDTVTVRVTVGM